MVYFLMEVCLVSWPQGEKGLFRNLSISYFMQEIKIWQKSHRNKMSQTKLGTMIISSHNLLFKHETK